MEEKKDNKRTILLIVIITLIIILGYEVFIIINNSNNKETKPEEENVVELDDNNNSSVQVPNESLEVVNNTIEYTSLFKEEKGTIIDYDLNTSQNIDYKSVYNDVIKESSKLKKSNGTNVFNYVGRVKVLGDKYYYINYDVNYYNLPKGKFSEYKDQILEDKNNVKNNCLDDDCYLSITTGYSKISKYLIKKAFYYYIYDKENNKTNTTSIISSDFDLASYIPDEWLKLGKYKTKKEMIKNMLIMIDETHTYNNYLVVYDLGNELKMKYKGKSVTIANKSTYNSVINEFYK